MQALLGEVGGPRPGGLVSVPGAFLLGPCHTCISSFCPGGPTSIRRRWTLMHKVPQARGSTTPGFYLCSCMAWPRWPLLGSQRLKARCPLLGLTVRLKLTRGLGGIQVLEAPGLRPRVCAGCWPGTLGVGGPLATWPPTTCGSRRRSPVSRTALYAAFPGHGSNHVLDALLTQGGSTTVQHRAGTPGPQACLPQACYFMLGSLGK